MRTIHDLGREDSRLLRRLYMVNSNHMSHLTEKGIVNQDITRVINLVTKESALYNIQAPRNGRTRDEVIQAYVDGSRRYCPFCKPVNISHDFGKIESAHSFTTPNPTAYDHLSGIVIFKKHNPLAQTEEEVVDHFNTAFELVERLQGKTKGTSHPQLIWNCMPKSGTNVVHGHMQVLLAQIMPYSDVFNWARNAVKYNNEFGSDYLEDLCSAHESIGLSLDDAFVSLTPKKERELVIVREDKDISAFASEIYRNLDAMIYSCNMRSFNLTCYPTRITGKEYMIARIVDRGDPLNGGIDFAGMEIFGEPVIRTDPYDTKKKMEEYLCMDKVKE